MHIADGVLSTPIAAATTVGAVALLIYSARHIKEEEIVKISLLTSVFFITSFIRVPVGPTSIHPLMVGLVGLMLGRRAPLAIAIGLILQAVLFQHGGLTTLGANTLLLSLPALMIVNFFTFLRRLSPFWQGWMTGFGALLGSLSILIILLATSNSIYTEGTFPVVKMLLWVYLPLAIIEGTLTGFVIKYVQKVRPSILSNRS